MDQLGHGERRQHPFSDAKSFPEAFKAGRQDYYFRYNIANQLSLVGESLMGWMVWDLMRGVDLLYQTKGIDKDRIILLGAVAGGGDPAAVTAALDERITAVAPFNFGGPQPETVFPLPADAETTFNYLGGGSWESTRNLRLSGRDGFAPWLIVASISPRRLIYGHEFSWDRERDPVWKRLQKVYDWYGVPERLAFATGKGKLSGKPPESTHCNNIGPEHRQGIYAALKKWFDMPIPEEYRKRRPPEDLQCLTPDVVKEMKPKKVHELAAELAKEQIKVARTATLKVDPADQSEAVSKRWQSLVHDDSQYGLSLNGAAHQAGVHWTGVLRLQRFGDNRQMALPFSLLVPAGKPKECDLVVAVAQQGRKAFLKERSSALAGLLDKGFMVCLPDLTGSGETQPAGDSRGRTSVSTSLSASEQMLGGTLLARRIKDLSLLLVELRKQAASKPSPGYPAIRRTLLWGDSFAPANGAQARVEVPLDVDQPPQAEPMGGLVVLLAALGDKKIHAVYVRGGLVSFQSLLQSPFLHVPHDALLPGVLAAGDLPDVVAALAPRT
jgi:hypothetical protein